MARIGNQPRNPRTLEYQWASLVLSWRLNKPIYDVHGELESVALPDRERIAHEIAQHLDIPHEDAYLCVWNDVKKGWEEPE